MCAFKARFQVQSSTIYYCKARTNYLLLFISILIFTQLINNKRTIQIDIFMSEEQPLRQSILMKSQTNQCIGCLQMFDIFAFLPVPKDETISTKQSIAGSILFLVLILTYILYDFIKFIRMNPPIQQTYRTPLDQSDYTLPDFALAFMTTNKSQEINDYTQFYDDLFTYQWNVVTKSVGNQTNQPIIYENVTYIDKVPFKFDKISWMNNLTKQFYYILRTPTLKNLSAHGLLYTSNETKYIQVKASFCTDSPTCLPLDSRKKLSNYGRFFLFIENQIDNSTVSLQQSQFQSNNNFLLYNFFTILDFYKRITVTFQVVKTQILPDYFFRFTTQNYVRLQVDKIFEQLSVVNSVNTSNTDAIAFNMQLSPYILNNRVSYSTIIDHISLWGAFTSVIFTLFAFIFLAYNRKKFYKKNPQWSHFKQTLQKKTIANEKEI